MTTQREPTDAQHATRRDFLKTSGLGAVTIGGLSLACDVQAGEDPENNTPSMQIGFHTDAFNSSYWNFERCLPWAQQHDVHRIECGVIDGVSWIHGLGYQPHVALYEDPLLLRRKMEKYGVLSMECEGQGGPMIEKSLSWLRDTLKQLAISTDAA